MSTGWEQVGRDQSGRRVVASLRRHRVWCSLWWGCHSCDCGQVDVADLIAWHVERRFSGVVCATSG